MQLTSDALKMLKKSTWIWIEGEVHFYVLSCTWLGEYYKWCFDFMCSIHLVLNLMFVVVVVMMTSATMLIKKLWCFKLMLIATFGASYL